MITLGPLITVSNVVVNKYEGEVKLGTSHISFIEINSEVEQFEAFQQSFQILSSVGGGMDKNFGPSKRLFESKEVSLANITCNNVDNLYCTFVGRVGKVLNKVSPWYEKCKQCNSIVHPEGNNKVASCTECMNKNNSFSRHYLLKLVVTDENEEVYTTLFDVAKAIIGCPVNTYAEKMLTIFSFFLCCI
ncbi:hypothetical protein ACS0TY_003839 [Phlomoides rotata]